MLMPTDFMNFESLLFFLDDDDGDDDTAMASSSSLRSFMNLGRTLCTRQRVSQLYSVDTVTTMAQTRAMLATSTRSFSQSRISASSQGEGSGSNLISKQSPIPLGKASLTILEDDDAPVDLSEDSDIVNGARPGTAPLHARRPPDGSTPEEWRKHRVAMKEKFPDGWSPPRKISRDAMDGLRQLRALDPETFTTEVLAERFKISPEAVRRILKSKWTPSSERKDKLVKREKVAKEKAFAAKAAKIKEEMMPFVREDKKDDRKAERRQSQDRLTMT